MLQTEYGTASNIKSRVNRLSVLSAITSAQQRLKLYNKLPPNGLVLYTGTIMTDDGKEKKVNIDFEPFKPINTSLYMCDNKFHVEALTELLESDNRYGFIGEQRGTQSIRLAYYVLLPIYSESSVACVVITPRLGYGIVPQGDLWPLSGLLRWRVASANQS